MHDEYEEQRGFFDLSKSSDLPEGHDSSNSVATVTPSPTAAASTVVIRDKDKILNKLISFTERAVGDTVDPTIRYMIDKYGATTTASLISTFEPIAAKNPNFKMLLVADIQPENIGHIKELLAIPAVNIRHIEGNKVKFILTSRDYIATSKSMEGGLPDEIICSTSEDLLTQMRDVFDRLWESSILAETRIAEIERGVSPQITQVVRGDEDVAKVGLQITSNVKNRLCACAGRNAPIAIFEIESYNKAYREMLSRGAKIQLVTEITKENVGYCKRMISEDGVELRHIDEVIMGYFSIVDEKEFMASSSMEQRRPVPYILYSNSTELTNQYQHLFDLEWKRGIPAEQKIREIEEGIEPQRIELISGNEAIVRTSTQFASKALNRLCVCADVVGPSVAVEIYSRSYKIMKDHGVKVQYITKITNDNLPYCKVMIRDLGVEVRHQDEVRGLLAIVDSKEYLAGQSLEEGKRINHAIRSNIVDLVEQNQYLFDSLWEKAVPARKRIEEIEHGINLGYTKYTYDLQEILNTADRFASELTHDAFLIESKEASLRRDVAVFQKLARRAREKGVIVRVLVPSTFFPNSSSPSTSGPGGVTTSIPPTATSLTSTYRFDEIKRELDLEGIEFRIAQHLLSDFYLGIYDQKNMITAQHIEPEEFRQAPEREEEVVYGTISTNGETVANMLSIFDALWHETELKEMEQKNREIEENSRRQAQLLQDILSHDIMNYNQIIKLNVELLQDEEFVQRNPSLKLLLERTLEAVDGSTILVEKARKLGRVLSTSTPKLKHVNLIDSINHALALVRATHPQREVKTNHDYFQRTIMDDPQYPSSTPVVLADELLDEVFTNLFSNAVKYTEAQEVSIEIGIRDGSKESSFTTAYPSIDPANSWHISVTDKGRGIPDYMKGKIFSRYMTTTTGSGLGLSIVNALVVERYKGSVKVSNRVPDDYTKGTMMEIWLPKAKQNKRKESKLSKQAYRS